MLVRFLEWFERYLQTYAGQDVMTASRTSKEYISVFDFPAMSFWKMPRIGSIWLFAAISAAPLGIMEERSLESAGTFPLDSHKAGMRTGAISAL